VQSATIKSNVASKTPSLKNGGSQGGFMAAALD